MAKKNGIGAFIFGGIATLIAITTFFIGRQQAIKNGIVEAEVVKNNAMKVPMLETKVQEHSEKIAVIQSGIVDIKDAQKIQNTDIKEILQRLPKK